MCLVFKMIMPPQNTLRYEHSFAFSGNTAVKVPAFELILSTVDSHFITSLNENSMELIFKRCDFYFEKMSVS